MERTRMQGAMARMDALLEDLEGFLRRDWRRGREAVFLPWRGACWGQIAPLWRAAAQDPDWQCYVVPVPWRYRDADGALKPEIHRCGTPEDPLPPEVPVTAAEDFDLSAHLPDLVVIQNPWDGFNVSHSVEPEYYSVRLLASTAALVCVPLFRLEGMDAKQVTNLKHLADMPGTIHSDLVVVQSEEVREAYLDNLVQFAGAETRGVWAQKIVAGDAAPEQLWERIGQVVQEKEGQS